MNDKKNIENINKLNKILDVSNIINSKNLKKRNEILEWAAKQEISAHDTFDDLNDKEEAIKCFYAEECPKDESGMVLSLHDAEILAYEYARRLLAIKGL